MKSNHIGTGLVHLLATAVLAMLAALAVFLLVVQPWQIHWGATDAELSQALPGDELVAQPQDQTTRAITIDAPATSVWPWLVQMGQGRGGLYSYETLENVIGCDMHNADSIDAEMQNIAVGDRVRMYPEGSGPPPYTVAGIVPDQALILGHTTEPGGVPTTVTSQTEWSETWAFVLQPIDNNSTRLIIRDRSFYADPAMHTIMSTIAPGYFVMERGMLVGLKERVERSMGLAANYTAADGWGAASLLVALAGLIALLFVGRWPHKLAIVPVGAVLWMMTLFFGYPSALVAAVLALAVILALVWNYLSTHRASVFIK